MQEWLGKNIHDKNIAEIIKTVLRLNTYGNDSDIQSIGSAFLQISSASVGGATYLNWGWQTLVDGLEMSAKDHKPDNYREKSHKSRKKKQKFFWMESDAVR
ncbi:MAG: hypothetical protein ACJ703_09525 [Nitrososphaera sp.]